MSVLRLKRLKNEALEAAKHSMEGISYSPIGDSLDKYEAIFIGPQDSVYAGMEIHVSITLPEKYPFEAPLMKTTTNVLHPNVYENGEICMSVLHNGKDDTNYEEKYERWMPSKSLATCLLSFQQVLQIPNCESPANLDAALLYNRDFNEFKYLAQSRLIKEQQERALEKCQVADMIKSQKRKRIVDEHKNKIKKKISNLSEEDKNMYASLIPEEPTTGGVIARMRTHEGIFQRSFPLDNKTIVIFDFLGSKGIIANALYVSEGGPGVRIDRGLAEKKNFNDLGLKGAISVNIDDDIEEEESD